MNLQYSIPQYKELKFYKFTHNDSLKTSRCREVCLAPLPVGSPGRASCPGILESWAGKFLLRQIWSVFHQVDPSCGSRAIRRRMMSRLQRWTETVHRVSIPESSPPVPISETLAQMFEPRGQTSCIRALWTQRALDFLTHPKQT